MENKCFMCEKTSQDKVLVKIETEGKENYICVACLPQVIH
jgi:hypothetical protein